MPQHVPDSRDPFPFFTLPGPSSSTVTGSGINPFTGVTAGQTNVTFPLPLGPAGGVCYLLMCWEDYWNTDHLTPTPITLTDAGGATIVQTFRNTGIVSGLNSSYFNKPYQSYNGAFLTYTMTGSEPGFPVSPTLTVQFSSPGFLFWSCAGINLAGLATDSLAHVTFGPVASETISGPSITDEGDYLGILYVGHTGPDAGYTVSTIGYDPATGLQGYASAPTSAGQSLSASVLAGWRRGSSDPSYVGEVPTAGDSLSAKLVSDGGTFDGLAVSFHAKRDPVGITWDLDPTVSLAHASPPVNRTQVTAVGPGDYDSWVLRLGATASVEWQWSNDYGSTWNSFSPTSLSTTGSSWVGYTEAGTIDHRVDYQVRFTFTGGWPGGPFLTDWASAAIHLIPLEGPSGSFDPIALIWLGTSDSWRGDYFPQGHVWQLNTDESWTNLTWGLPTRTILSVVPFDGSLFAATLSGVDDRYDSNTIAEVWKLDPGATSWTLVMAGQSTGAPYDMTAAGISAFASANHLDIYNDQLYVFAGIFIRLGHSPFTTLFDGLDIGVWNGTSFDHAVYVNEFGVDGTFFTYPTERFDLLIGDWTDDIWLQFDGTTVTKFDENSASCVWWMIDDPAYGLFSVNEYGFVYRSSLGGKFTDPLEHLSPWNPYDPAGFTNSKAIYEDISDGFRNNSVHVLTPPVSEKALWTLFRLGDKLYGGTCARAFPYTDCDIRHWMDFGDGVGSWIESAALENIDIAIPIDRSGQGFITSSTEHDNGVYVGTGIHYYDDNVAQESKVYRFDGTTLTEIPNPAGFPSANRQFNDAVQCMWPMSRPPHLRWAVNRIMWRN